MGSCLFWILVFRKLLMGSWKLLFIVNQLILINICHLTRITREAIKSLLLQLCFRERRISVNYNKLKERENKCQYVTNILKENNYPKSFLYDCLRGPTLTDCNSPEDDSAGKGFAIVPYIQGIAEPIRRVLNNCGIKVALKPFQTLEHIFSKPKDAFRLIRKHMLYTLYHAVIARKYIWVKQNASFAHV